MIVAEGEKDKLMAKKSLGFSLAAATAAVLFSFDGYAQELFRGDTVLTRPRPEYDPIGIRAGSFFFFPRATVVEEYNDNIFATEHNREDDFITQLSPGLSVESDWNNHALNFGAEGDFGIYAKHNSENYQDYAFVTDGRLDITRDAQLSGGGGATRRHEDRGNPDSDFGAKDPTVYYQYDAFATYFQQFGRFSATVDGQFFRRDYDDNENLQGQNINNDDRDRNVYGGGIRGGYEIIPAYEAFVRFDANNRVYDETPDDTGVKRDSWGYGIVGGLAFDISGITVGDVYFGYRDQIYDRDLSNISGPTGGMSLDWNVTPLTTVGANIARTIEETTETGASGYWATAGTLRVDHELLRNVLLNVSGGVTNNDYEGIARNDFIYRAGIGGRYLLNRHFSATLNYVFTRRDSKDAPGGDEDYTENRVLIGITGQL